MKINLIIFISEFNRGGAGNSLFRLCKYLPKNLYNINVKAIVITNILFDYFIYSILI